MGPTRLDIDWRRWDCVAVPRKQTGTWTGVPTTRILPFSLNNELGTELDRSNRSENDALAKGTMASLPNSYPSTRHNCIYARGRGYHIGHASSTRGREYHTSHSITPRPRLYRFHSRRQNSWEKFYETCTLEKWMDP